jgi:MFS family permease
VETAPSIPPTALDLALLWPLLFALAFRPCFSPLLFALASVVAAFWAGAFDLHCRSVACQRSPFIIRRDLQPTSCFSPFDSNTTPVRILRTICDNLTLVTLPGQRATEQTRWLTPGVLGIGLASLFSDWGHEAATSLLPAFLATLGAPAVALGIIEGISDGLSSFAKLAGGWIADRPAWRKPNGIVGYSATAVTTFGYAFAHSWPAILLLRALGWMGRGSRGPSRDALLADSVDPAQVGRAFGFERAMDTFGAVLGPLCAALLVGALGIRTTIRWTLLPGLTAALAFAFLVPAGKRNGAHRAPSFISSFSQLPKNYWRLLTGIFAHGIGAFAPTLLILRATQALTPSHGAARAAALSVALYTFHNFMSAAVSYPAGALGDRIGKRNLLALGYAVGTLAYLGFIVAPPALATFAILFGVAGIHDAFQQSLEKSAASDILPGAIRGSGFGVLATANGIGDLVSSVVVGALWSTVGPAAGFAYAAIFSALGALLVLRARPN